MASVPSACLRDRGGGLGGIETLSSGLVNGGNRIEDSGIDGSGTPTSGVDFGTGQLGPGGIGRRSW